MEYLTREKTMDWNLPATVACFKVKTEVTTKSFIDLDHEIRQGLLCEPGKIPEVLHGAWHKVAFAMDMLKKYPYTKEQQVYRMSGLYGGFMYTSKFEVFVPCDMDGTIKVVKKVLLNAWYPFLAGAEDLELDSRYGDLNGDEPIRVDSSSDESEYSSSESEDDDSESVISVSSEDSVQSVSDSEDDEYQGVQEQLRILLTPEEEEMFPEMPTQ